MNFKNELHTVLYTMFSDIKSETELIFGKEEILVKKRIAVDFTNSIPDTLQITIPFRVKAIHIRYKYGDIIFKKLNTNLLELKIPKLKKRMFACEINALLNENIYQLDKLNIIDWPSSDLYQIKFVIKPYQVLGFRKLILDNDIWIAKENTTKNITGHIANKRIARIEYGHLPKFILRGKLIVKAFENTQIIKLTLNMPQNNNRHRVKIIPTNYHNYEIYQDDTNNQRILINYPILPGKVLEADFEFPIEYLDIPFYQIDLGTIEDLKKLTSHSEFLNKLTLPTQNWPINFDDFQLIKQSISNYKELKDLHHFLFEFTNRRLTYQINEERGSVINAFENKIGDCSEFSDLLITLHRACGIPSRLKEGFIVDIFNKNNLEGHAWVEFLTRNGWIECDPTWGTEIGITAQHIEFQNSENDYSPSKYEVEFTGKPPVISWDFNFETIN